MSQTKEGAIKTRETNYRLYGEDYYRVIGKAGGSAKVPKGFALMTPEKRSEAGRLGGQISRRTKHA
jgi:general stress protein YciG